MTKHHEAQQSETSRRAASSSYPLDRFDEIPRSSRVGAHRVTAQPRVVWLFVVGGLVGALILTAVGVVGVNFMNARGTLPQISNERAAPASPNVQAQLDPDATVVVLDGTPTSGDLALRLASIITETNLGKVFFAGPSASADVEISAVFFSDPADEAAAKGLANELGGISSYQTDDYQEYDARLIVLLGTDYGGPGLEAE